MQKKKQNSNRHALNVYRDVNVSIIMNFILRIVLYFWGSLFAF